MRGKCLLDQDDLDLWYRYNWCQTPYGHWYTRWRVNQFRRVDVYLHRFILERWGHEIPDGFVVDHKNGCGWDNTKDNLRIVSKTTDLRNRRMNGVLPQGVFRQTRDGQQKPYRAKVTWYQATYHGNGSYATPKEAADEVVRLTQRLHAYEYSEMARFC